MATLVSVCGTSRSGSTMLDLMLGNAPDAFSCGEVAAWFRPFRRHHFRIECSCGQDPCPLWQDLARLPAQGFHAGVAERVPAEFVVDSSKDLAWLIDSQRWAGDRGLATYTLVLWKDPIALAHSFWKRGHGLLAWRRHFVGYYSRIFDLGLPLGTVPFEALSAAPGEVLARACQAVGMPSRPGQERFWEKTHHYLFGSGGVRRQVSAGDSEIRGGRGFGPEFQEPAERLAERIADDPVIQDLLDRLRANSVLDAAPGALAPGFPLRRPYPGWYYQRRLRRALRRYLPERYDPGAP